MRRLPALDLLRFIAAMGVVLFHYGFRGAIQGKYLAVSYPEIAGIFQFGFLALDMLFVLSGFVILLSVEAGGSLASRFVASRVARLYPAFLVAATLTLAIVWPFDPPFGVPLRDALWNLTLAPAWFGARPIDGAYWTLAVELNFYFLVTACLLLPRWLGVDRLLWVWAAAIALSRWFPVPLYVQFVVMPQWGPLFLIGCVLYRAWRPGWTGWRAAQFAFAAMLVVLAVQQQMKDLGGAFAMQFPVALSLMLLAMLLAGLAALCATPRWLERGGGFAVTLGAITYPLYLVHQKIGYLTITLAAPWVGRWGALGLAVATVLALAWVLHHRVERPLNARLRRWLEPRLRWLDLGRGQGCTIPEVAHSATAP